MVYILFNLYKNIIRYVLFIFYRWGKLGTENLTNLLLVEHQLEKAGFKPFSLAAESQLPISELYTVSLQMRAVLDQWTPTAGKMPEEIPQIHMYTQIHTPIHTPFKKLKWYITHSLMVCFLLNNLLQSSC